MDLGKCRIRRNRCDSLKWTVHAHHGIVWTDGQTIFLAPIEIHEDQLLPTTSKKLGQFEHIASLCWSCNLDCSAGSDNQHTSSSHHSFCYLCVVHRDTVSLWKVTGHTPSLQLKQVRKINATPLPQGCLWHPTTDVLCILTKDKGSFYFKHTNRKGSYALPPLESGTISCGCWSRDGKKLLLGLGTIVLVYHWQDIEKSVSDYTIIAWKIPKVDGKLLCLSPYLAEKYVCTAELPLDKLCQTQDVFHVPDFSKKEDENNSISHNHLSGTAHTDSLMCLKPTKVTSQGSAQLVMFELQEAEPRKLCSHDVPGVLSLDLLFCQGGTDTVVVGSNATSMLHVYSLADNTVLKIADMNLEENERPSGLCGAMSTNRSNKSSSEEDRHFEGVLVAAGKHTPSDSAFPSVTMHDERQVTLKYLPLPGQASRTYIQNPKELPNSKMFREIQLPNGNSKVHLLRIGPLRGRHSEGSLEQENHIKPETNLNKSASSASSAQNRDQPKRSVSLMSRSLPDPPIDSSAAIRKLPNIPDTMFQNHSFEMDDGSHSAKTESMTDTTERSESPEFNLVLPNSHSNFYAMDARQPHSAEVKSKILLVDGSGSSISSTELQTERTSFQSNPASFKCGINTNFDGSECNVETHNKQTTNGCISESIASATNSETKSDASKYANKADDGIGDGEYSEKDIEECLQNMSHDPETRDLDARDQSAGSGSSQAESQMSQQLQDMEHTIRSQGEEILNLQARISNISSRVDASLGQAGYSPFSQPELITLVHRRGGSEQRKLFLLDQKRLQLEPVKQAFELTTLEMFIGDSRVVVSSNSEGYIPLLFEASSTVYIYGQSKT